MRAAASQETPVPSRIAADLQNNELLSFKLAHEAYGIDIEQLMTGQDMAFMDQSTH